MKATKHEFAIDYLLELLQATESKEFFVLNFYIYWCESVTLNAREFQQVLANASINKWFLLELKKLESDFKQLAAFYPELQNSANEMDKLQAKCYLPLMAIHPQALLLNAKRRELKPNPKTLQGILIESSILIQN